MTPAEFEAAVLKRSNALVEDHANWLARYGLHIVCKGLRDASPGNGGRTSEIEVTVYFQGQLLDSVDFFVLQNGTPVAPMDEVLEWLRKQLNDLPRRHKLRSTT
jgi:hypothetical protein